MRSQDICSGQAATGRSSPSSVLGFVQRRSDNCRRQAAIKLFVTRQEPMYARNAGKEDTCCNSD